MLTNFAELISAEQVDILLIFAQKETNVSLPTLGVIPIEDSDTALNRNAERVTPV